MGYCRVPARNGLRKDSVFDLPRSLPELSREAKALSIGTIFLVAPLWQKPLPNIEHLWK